VGTGHEEDQGGSLLSCPRSSSPFQAERLPIDTLAELSVQAEHLSFPLQAHKAPAPSSSALVAKFKVSQIFPPLHRSLALSIELTTLLCQPTAE
jgi:hypothetical protein